MVCLVFGPFLDFLDGFGPFRVRVAPFAIIRKPPLLTRRDGSIRAIRRPPRYLFILTSHILLSPFSVFYDSRILRFRECWLFEFLVKALKDTTPGRCRRLRRLPIPHRRLIQEQHFQNPKLSKSDFPDFPIFRYLLFVCFTMALKDTTPGRCRRLRRLPIPHSRLIQEQNFKITKFSKTAPEEFWNPDRPPTPAHPGAK